MRLCILFILCSLGVVVRGVDGPVQVLMPYSIAGRVVNYDNVAFDAESGITLSIRNTNGNVIAKGQVFTPSSALAWNFRLDVPLATRAGGGYVAWGDTLTMSAIDAAGVVYEGLLKGGDANIAKAGGTVTLRVMLSNDANGNGVADLYESNKEYEMWLNGIEDESFDPAKDYDGDGVSNFKEYLAGTDPFDAKDFFRVNLLGNEVTADGDVIALSFEANAGRSYIVHEASELKGENAQWTRGVFRLDKPDGAKVERVVNDSKTWSMRTIYLIKSGSRRFYKLELEQ